jgi:release factor glutamine methyltransferase
MRVAERSTNIKVMEALKRAEGYLAKHGVEGARLSAEHLLAKRLGCSRLDLYLRFDETLEEGLLGAYREDLVKRAEHYPLQYMLGEVEFLGLRFKVREGVFIPRPETELLVEWIEELLGGAPALELLEFGVGSGVIAGSLAARHEGWRGVALDISPEAVSLARENFEALGVAGRVTALVADGASAPASARSFDLYVSNPPYVPSGDIAGLQTEVSRHENAAALDGGPDGLRFYPALGAEGLRALRPGGLAAFEIGHGQADAIVRILETLGYERATMRRDYNRLERMVTAFAPGEGVGGDG